MVALPGNHTFNTSYIQGYSPSVGGTPVAVNLRVPYRCRILQVSSCLNGAITTADASVACAINGGTAFATLTITQAGSAAGTVSTQVPASATYANSDDYITLTPSGASGSSIAAHFQVTIRRA